jgi:ATP-dependent exoDNAse (exonuclease V) beta subunit
MHITELARQYELDGGISFRGFIAELREAAETAQAAEAPILEEGSQGVRMMTVHRAKGLEFPVVVLADLTCKLNRPDASRFIDPGRRLCALKLGGWAPLDLLDAQHVEVERDRAEGVRLAYVAATRARDLLVVPAVGDEPWSGGWLDPLNAALYPTIAHRRAQQHAPRCPRFKSKDTVLARPNDDPASETTVCPGLHAFERGYRIVWWDPTALHLGLEPTLGIRREDLIHKDVAPALVVEDTRTYERWRTGRDTAIADGQQPSIRVVTAREWADGTGDLPPDGCSLDAVSILDVSRNTARPSGSVFGALVHAMLATVSLDAPRSAIEQVAVTEGRLLAATSSDVSAAADVVARVLDSPLLVRARSAAASGRCRRETPVTIMVGDGLMVEGIVDLAFLDDHRWTVVDYKTDRELATAGQDRYRRQVALYASAIAQATGVPCTGVVLVI